MATPEKNYD